MSASVSQKSRRAQTKLFLFSALLPVAAAWIFSDDNAVRYQHPVLDDFMFSHNGAYATESAATHAR